MNTTDTIRTAPTSTPTAVLPIALSDVELRRLVFESGACTRLANPDDMFPHPADTAAIERAKRVCDGCGVLAACREYARRNGDEHGVWGGRLHQPAGTASGEELLGVTA